MSDEEKKQHDLLNGEIKPKLLCLPYTKQGYFLQKKSFLRKRTSGGLNKKSKEGFLTALARPIKDPHNVNKKAR